ncbi:MAG: 2-phospho-L-lactate transferase [Actinomycetota bacterium]
MVITVLAGGVGAARFLRGLSCVVDPESITVISNTGDDFHIYGAHVSPDLDIVSYTLAGIVDEERGWGIAEDTFTVLEGMRAIGIDAWFTLGDKDFATCLARASFISSGGKPSEFAARLCSKLGVAVRILPMTDDPVATYVQIGDGREIHFQEYWVRRHAQDVALGVRLHGAANATPAAGVLEALRSSDVILVAPSNPVVSIGTILSVPGIRDALVACAAPIVGISPIVGGAPVRGMADKLLGALDVEVSAPGVASLYSDFIDGFLIDLVDEELIEQTSMAGACVVASVQTMMRSLEDSAALAKAALSLAERLS